jgi:ATP-dependent HslUV protease ATP-binding subunit HslU
LQRDNAKAKHADKAIEEAESFVLDILDNSGQTSKRVENEKRLKEGLLDEKIIEVPMDIYRQAMQMSKSKSTTQNANDDGSMGGMGEDMSNVINMLGDYMNRSGMGRGGKGEKKSETMKVTVAEALQIYKNYYYSRNIDDTSIIRMAREATEQSGIVFIDEIDKLAVSSDSSGGGGVSRWSHREGVQKELLTLLEGETVQTKHGPIKTHHILFIAAGAFHNTSVSDLMPELQGRLPVRVELKALNERDMRRVLSEKKYNLLNESKALLSAEGVNLEFTEDAIDEIARFATVLNSTRGNIGARRLTNVMHTVLEDISFLAHRMSGTTQTIDGKYVQTRMKFNDPSSSEENLHKYII